MTNLEKNKSTETIHLNITSFETVADIWAFIDEWLPRNYSKDVNRLLPEDMQMSETTYIRKVKMERIDNTVIVNALLRHAQFNKRQLENTGALHINP